MGLLEEAVLRPQPGLGSRCRVHELQTCARLARLLASALLVQTSPCCGAYLCCGVVRAGACGAAQEQLNDRQRDVPDGAARRPARRAGLAAAGARAGAQAEADRYVIAAIVSESAINAPHAAGAPSLGQSLPDFADRAVVQATYSMAVTSHDDQRQLRADVQETPARCRAKL